MLLLGCVLISNVPAERAPHTISFGMLLQCEHCSIGGRGCNKTLPCSNCIKGDQTCVPKMDDEFVKRAKTLQDRILNGEFEHNDLASYTLNAHAIKTHKKKLFKSQDMKDVTMRVETMWPLVKKGELPSLCIVDNLPQGCLELINKFPLAAWKVEWMWNGSFDFQMNDLYKGRYFKFSRHKERGVYTKLWDGMGFAKYEMGYKMWVESLYRPNKVMRYEGNAYLMNEKRVACQVARVISHVYDYAHIVTVTVVTL